MLERDRLSAERLRAFAELTKPGITRMVLLTSGVGFYLASRDGLDLGLLTWTLLGVALAASGTNALNQWWEREQDARMRRTAGRPLPSGRLASGEALAFATAISVLGLAVLAAFVGALATTLVALILTMYVFLYTPFKRRSSWATVIGGVPGALPIVAGWVAAGGPLDAVAWSLFGILFLWQMPHFLALAWIYRDDYRRGGFAMLSADDPDGRRTGRHIVLWTLALLPVSLLPAALGVAGPLYLAGALGLGAMFLIAGVAVLARREEARAWRLFFASVLYLPALLLLMAFDRLPI